MDPIVAETECLAVDWLVIGEGRKVADGLPVRLRKMDGKILAESGCGVGAKGEQFHAELCAVRPSNNGLFDVQGGRLILQMQSQREHGSSRDQLITLDLPPLSREIDDGTFPCALRA